MLYLGIAIGVIVTAAVFIGVAPLHIRGGNSRPRPPIGDNAPRGPLPLPHPAAIIARQHHDPAGARNARDESDVMGVHGDNPRSRAAGWAPVARPGPG
jgi:hypothetical protein